MAHDRTVQEKDNEAASLRSQRARYAALIMHAKHDSREVTLHARLMFMQRFEKSADPDWVLDESERMRRAQLLKRAYFVRLARLSAEARAKKREQLVSGSF